MSHYSGQCLCGAVTYKVEKPIRFVAHDHCSICRRAHGAPFVTWCGVSSEKDQFQLLSGKESLNSFKSSAEAERQFCNFCGSPLFFRSTNWPGEIHFTRVSLVDDIEEQPKAHVYYSDKVGWLEVNDSLPKLGGPSGTNELDSEG